WAAGTLAPGASTPTYTVSGTIPPTASGSLTNRATVTATSADPTPANNSAQATTTVIASADLAVATTGPASAPAGTEVTLAVTVTNAGPSPAANVVVTDTLPAGLTFVSATGGASHSGGVVTWSAATLAPGGAGASYDLVV